MNDGWYGFKVVNRWIKYLAACDPFDDFSDVVDLPNKDQATDQSDPSPYSTEEYSVSQEDRGDSRSSGPKGFENADISRLLDDDHEEGRQNAKPCHGDDHEQ